MTNRQTETLLIDYYSRADALRDGTLVDVTDLARRAGFTVPVAFTGRAYWWLVPHDSLEDDAHRVLGLLRELHRDSRTAGPSGGAGGRTVSDWFELVAETGDDGEPVLTVTSPGETLW